MIALFFDTETTGVKSWRNPGFIPRLVQLGAILQDLDTGRVLAELNVIVHGAGQIPLEASNVHGITTELSTRFALNKEAIEAVFGDMVDKAEVVVAHNIEYDLDVLRDNMLPVRLVIERKQQFCTMQACLPIVKAPLTDKQVAYFRAKGIKPDAPYKVPNLTETFKHFYGVPFEGAHDAMADIRACRDVFLTLIEKGHYTINNGKVAPVDLDEAA